MNTWLSSPRVQSSIAGLTGITGFAAIALIAVMCVASPVYALQDYADEIQRVLELEDKPTCLFCHARNANGVATNTLFNAALKDHGFSRRLGLPSLRRAIAALDEQNIDSDGDGVGDIDELRAMANPNDARDAGMPAEQCSIAPVTRRSNATLLALLVACGLLVRRRVTRVADLNRGASR